MMVTGTETLTSTLHHNIFAYLDYVFSATFILSDFNPYFTNLISTSIHGTRKKRKKTRQEQEIKVSRITAPGEKEKIL